MLGVAYQTFVTFLARYLEARAAWEDGKQFGRASFRFSRQPKIGVAVLRVQCRRSTFGSVLARRLIVCRFLINHSQAACGVSARRRLAYLRVR